MNCYDVIIIGGGLAGLTAALHLRREGRSVLVLEKKRYPHHKVCGEYVSNEILPYLDQLGVPIAASGAVPINRFSLSTLTGKSVQVQLPLGGVGISRYRFDALLYEQALQNGVRFVFEAASSVSFVNDGFHVTAGGQRYRSRLAIGAYGKRSFLDKQLHREFIQHKSHWLGVKGHYEFDDFPEDQVALHTFKGGYGGLSKTETGAVNFCYLASYDSFQKQKTVDDFNRKVVAENPYLKHFLARAKPIFETPMAIAQISFEKKSPLEQHMLMCGDTAGLIHPLCGNGMAMAVHSAKIAAEHQIRFLGDTGYTREKMESDYAAAWRTAFTQRLWFGRQLQSFLMREKLSHLAVQLVAMSPAVLRTLIQNTHGKPLTCS